MPARTLELLGRPIRGRVLLRYTGVLIGSLAGMSGVAAIAAFLYSEPTAAGRHAVVTVAAVAGGLALARLKGVSDDLRLNETLAITAIAFPIGASMLTWPFAASGVAWVDALFEAVSAITTTGLSTLGSPESLPKHLLFVRSWAQWYGGLVIVVLALALLIEPGKAAKRLAAQQISSEEIVSGTRRRSRDLLKVYLALTAGGFVFLYLLGASTANALVHSMSAVSTGGFSNLNDGVLAAAGVPGLVVIGIICLFGAISFPLQGRAWKRGPAVLWRDSQVRALLALSALVTLALAGAMALTGKLHWSEIAMHAPFLAVSAQTTTGFSTLDVASLDSASRLILITAMLIGGDIGSTAGGLKLYRFLIVSRIVRELFARTALPPHAVVKTTVSGEPADSNEGRTALAVVAVFLIVALLSWLSFLIYGLDPLNSLFDVASALGTVGLSAGVTNLELPTPLKLVLCLDMLMGRVEVVAFLILFYYRSWIPRGEVA